jgi:hypothetical protein
VDRNDESLVASLLLREGDERFLMRRVEHDSHAGSRARRCGDGRAEEEFSGVCFARSGTDLEVDRPNEREVLLGEVSKDACCELGDDGGHLGQRGSPGKGEQETLGNLTLLGLKTRRQSATAVESFTDIGRQRVRLISVCSTRTPDDVELTRRVIRVEDRLDLVQGDIEAAQERDLSGSVELIVVELAPTSRVPLGAE